MISRSMAVLGWLAVSACALGAGTAAQAAGVVISQVYGGGGNSGAPLQNDFIELFNAGSNAQSLNGWSVQYASSTGATWNNLTPLPDVTLAPGAYLLIQEGGGTNGVPLPAPDVIDDTPIALAAANGKVALVNSTTQLSGTCPTDDASVVDFIGYGSANCAEATAVAALSNTTAAVRNDGGCTDSDDNLADFRVGAPAPRNGATAPNPCAGSGGVTVSIGDVSLVEGDSGSSDAVFTVTLGEAVSADVTFDIATADGTATEGSDYVARANPATIAAGQTTYTFNVHVNGDTVPEANETFTVTARNIVGPGVSAANAVATGTILNDDPLHIYDLQGDGAHSPFLDANVTTTGEVTVIGGGGFFMQDAAGDGSKDTSDAVFVFTGGENPPGLAVGSVATVSGKLVEFYGMTEFAASPTPVVSVQPGKPTIQPIVLGPGVPSADPAHPYCGGSLVPADGVALRNFRCLQSMLVRVDEAVVSAPNFNASSQPLSEYYAYTADHSRPLRGPGLIYGTVIANPPPGYAPSIWRGTPEVFGVDNSKLLTAQAMNSGARFSATGIMGFDFGIGMLWPAQFQITDPGPAYPIAVRAANAGNLTIGSQNMLRFFNDVADSGSIDTCATSNPGSSDVCPTAAQFSVRLSKLSRQVREVLRAPAVLATEEVENIHALQSLADRIHADDPGLVYTPYLVEGNDVGGIDIGFLVRRDVTVNAVTQLGKDTQTIDGCGSNPPCLLNDRPPLLLDATLGSLRFAVLAIHNRSLSGVDDPVTGPRIRLKRLEQAQYVGAIVQSWQTNGSFALPDGDSVPDPDATVPLVVVGDYNAFQFSDGYADVYGQIAGTAIESENLAWAAPVTTPRLLPACSRAAIGTADEERYSFVFDGYAQELDQALLTKPAYSRCVRISIAHGNADLPEGGSEATDPTTPLRSADHDGFVLELRGNAPASVGRAR